MIRTDMSDSKKMTPMSPQFAAAMFFAVFALLFLFFTKYTLLAFKDSVMLSLFPSMIIVVLIGGCLGALLGSWLAKKGSWLRPFLVGILLSALAILILSGCLLIHSYLYDVSFSVKIQKWQDYFLLYGVIAASLTFTIGLWLIPITGFVAVYFNKRFLPGLMAADQLRFHSKDTIDE